MNKELLLKKIEQSSISKTTIAKDLGITRQGLYNKLEGKQEFKSSEIKLISHMLNLTSAERDAIFFSDYVD